MFLAIPPLMIGEGNKWVTTAPLIYQSQLYDLSVQVPSGFPTDLASIPIGFRNVFNINGKHRPAAIVHDYLYSIRGRHQKARLSRADCDAIFREAMVVSGVNWFTRQAMWLAVRAGGWACW